MVFVVCGLNHKTAPLTIREEVACQFSDPKGLSQWIALSPLNEAVILSTCNRTEIYGETENPPQLLSWLIAQQQPLSKTTTSYFYSHAAAQGIRHALRVASGLDSMMLGEPQILGQMKQAYQQACDRGDIKVNLRHLFPSIFRSSKRIRTKSGIGNNPISVAYAAVQRIGDIFKDYGALNVCLIGSGETSTLLAKYLHQQGVKHFLIASRSLENAGRLAERYGGTPLTISDIPAMLHKADVVISATTCPVPFISKRWVEDALKQRQNKAMCFLDLSVPRDIEPDVASLDKVSLYHLEDLQDIAEAGLQARMEAAQHAEQLVEIELAECLRRFRLVDMNHRIEDYRRYMHSLAQEELQRARDKLLRGDAQAVVLDEFCHRLFNKFIHHPTQGLREAVYNGREELLDLAALLFHSPEGALPA
ncbi:MAG: glutamyl-tRNA reductase [Legionella sp.]|nr:glutamyl-tRNA reductase [Legionella sp.]